jgi:hypothetical protein
LAAEIEKNLHKEVNTEILRRVLNKKNFMEEWPENSLSLIIKIRMFKWNSRHILPEGFGILENRFIY